MNYTKRYLDGYLSDEPLSRYEKLKSTRHKTTNDKAQTIVRNKARVGRQRVVDGLEYQNRYNSVT